MLKQKFATSVVVAGVWLATAAAWSGAADKMMGQMTPEMQQMMEKAKVNGAPNENHKALEPLMGKFSAKAKGWMKPGDKPEMSEGMAENSWVLGGRFVKQEYKGMWAGQPFEGMGFTGYDNVRGEYQSIWMDNMMTGMMHAAGPRQGSMVKQSGEFSCPMTGEKAMWFRSELNIKDKDNHTYTSYGKGPDGKEFKTMEITYKRMM